MNMKCANYFIPNQCYAKGKKCTTLNVEVVRELYSSEQILV